MTKSMIRQEMPKAAETVSLFLRGVAVVDAGRFKAAAQARGWTLGHYLARLLDLHDAARTRADGGDAGLRQVLDVLGLRTVER